MGNELERSLMRHGASPGWQEDARLIRSKVERCRLILDRLDRRSTRGTGKSPTAASLRKQLEKHLLPERLDRVQIDDHTQDFPLLLSSGAVLQSLVVLIENACEADQSGRPVTLDIPHPRAA